MDNFEIACVTKPNRFSPHEHITDVGGPANGGWTRPREEIIRQIDAGIASFYVRDPRTGKVATVGVVRESGKAPYLRTHADGYWNDNLLSLNECQYRAA